MGLFDKIKGFIGDPEDEDDFEEEQEENMDFVSKGHRNAGTVCGG